MEAYYLLNTHTAKATLTDADDLPVLGAVVDITFQIAGVDVAGQAWPLALTDQGDGSYEGLVQHDLTVTKNDKMTALINSTKGLARGHAEVTVKVVVDGS